MRRKQNFATVLCRTYGNGRLVQAPLAYQLTAYNPTGLVSSSPATTGRWGGWGQDNGCQWRLNEARLPAACDSPHSGNATLHGFTCQVIKWCWKPKSKQEQEQGQGQGQGRSRISAYIPRQHANAQIKCDEAADRHLKSSISTTFLPVWLADSEQWLTLIPDDNFSRPSSSTSRLACVFPIFRPLANSLLRLAVIGVRSGYACVQDVFCARYIVCKEGKADCLLLRGLLNAKAAFRHGERAC
ncbi:uncharacterized protein PG986_009326 [Apiospora aurea]|uniref:Uncharacterized protein n=1 Tax=Apiospora aurea TaxID=335848 RepID=A0ABR1Q7E7_9PEZI